MKPVTSTMDPFGIAGANLQVQQSWLSHPFELGQLLSQAAQKAWEVELHGLQRLSGLREEDAVKAAEGDERFTDPVWTDNPVWDWVKERYLFFTHTLANMYFEAPEVEAKTARRAAFWARQYLNLFAPTNFFWTNPVAIQKFIATGGQSIVDGLSNLSKDLLRGGDISMVDESPYRVGQNLATTPGSVVFRNRLVELIQYKPTTEQVHEVPILLVSPWINKYYVLDLTEQMSMVKYLVAQGFTVFVTSWKNPTQDMSDVTWDDYMLNGILECVNTAKDVTGAPHVNVMGYCIGGTGVASLMAWLNASPKYKGNMPIGSFTMFASLVDFSTPGDIEVFIGDDIVDVLEDLMKQQGGLRGVELQRTFRMLRPNSLIWRYFVHNYLYGETPPAIPVLFWNVDGTRLPRKMHSWYLRNLYVHNNLVKKDALTIAGQPIDLGRITQPLYIVGTEEDHITPWQSTFRIAKHLSGNVRYVLASSGHILGIINPPSPTSKRRYVAGEARGETDADAWRKKQEGKTGSWWVDWVKWLGERSGAKKAAVQPGTQKFPVLAPAPGTYVLER